MLCKLLTCSFDATERRIAPHGEVNLCADHGAEFDRWVANRAETPCAPHILIELRFACRFGPAVDPPLDQAKRGPEYVHRYKTGTE